MKKLKSLLYGAVCAFVFSFISMPSHAELVGNPGGLIYDTVLDITWAQPDVSPEGLLLRDWDEAKTWASELTLGGVSGWRLPYLSRTTGDSGELIAPADCSFASEVECRDNELGYMFYRNLGGTEGQPITESDDPDLELFQDEIGLTILPQKYWSGSDGAGTKAWTFRFQDGSQGLDFETTNYYSWAVHDGNVVPIPGAVWLLGSGLVGVIGLRRKRPTT